MGRQLDTTNYTIHRILVIYRAVPETFHLLGPLWLRNLVRVGNWYELTEQFIELVRVAKNW